MKERNDMDSENTAPEGAKTVTLEFPFSWTEGETIREITIPRPTAGHMRGLNIKKLESDVDEMLRLVQKLIGQPAKFVDKIDFSDLNKIMECVGSFLPSGPETGKTS